MPTHSRRRRLLVALSSIALVTSACADKEAPVTVEEAAPTPEAVVPTELDLWSGVPPLEQHPGDLAPVLEPRPGPDKPPSITETIELPFPPEVAPETSKPEIATGPLTVERFGPTGEQTLVDAVRVTFNQAMVPLASVEALASKTVPVTIDPMPPGKWRWLGTRTVAFYPEGRMPLSTTYAVTVPSGATSTAGGKLGKDVKFSFSTPTLALDSSDPWTGSTGIDLEPTVTLTFNQPIQRTAVMAALRWRAGKTDVAFAPVEVPAHASLEPWQRDRIVTIRAKSKLTPNTRYTISLPGGVFGEGPTPSKPISTEFTTYPPLRLSFRSCYGPCYPSGGINLDASTQIVDPNIEEKVHVTPAIEDMTVDASYGIQINGKLLGDTSYKVTVDAGVIDAFGQTLAKPFKGTIRLGPQQPELSLATLGRTPGVIERGAAKELRVRVAGIDRMELEGQSFGAAEGPTFLRAYPGDDWAWPTGMKASSWKQAFDVRGSRRKREERTIDLGELLGGNSMAWVLARSNKITADGYSWRTGFTQLLEVTDLGLAAAIDRDSGMFAVTSLASGEPIADVELSLVTLDAPGTKLWSGKTGSDGLAGFSYRLDTYSALLLLAEHGNDQALLRLDENDLRGQWRNGGPAPEDTQRVMFYTERTPYKPGETIHLSGIMREETHGPAGAVTMWRKDSTAKWKVIDPRGVDVASGDAKIGPFGTFSVDIATKEEGGTGTYQFSLEVPNLFSSPQTFWYGIPVETYRTPEFTVKVERPDSKALVYGDELDIDVIGEYLHGAPLVGGEVGWSLSRTSSDFRPPGSENDAFTFGIGSYYRPWYYGEYARGRRSWGGGWGGPPSMSLKTATGTLDARGKLRVNHHVVFVEPPPPGSPPTPPPPADDPPPTVTPTTYTLAATVTDQNRQSIAGSGSFVVHPARVYVGLRSDRSVYREGELLDAQAVLVDLDGARKAGQPIAIDVVRRETTRTAVEKAGSWTFEYKTSESRVGGCALTSAATPQPCQVAVDKAGQYVVRGQAKDASGNETRSELSLYVYGDDEVVWDQDERRVDIVADKRKYAPGDTAKLLLRSPFPKARGLVVVEREGIVSQESIVVEGGAAAIDVPITEAMVGGVSVSVMLARGRVEIPGAPPGQDLGMPAAAAGQLNLDVSTDSKAITVALEPNAREIAPKDTLSLAIKTTRKDNGEAVPAAVAVMVVDEGVLSLMDFKTPDPVAFFHYQRPSLVQLFALHANVLPRKDVTPTSAAAPGSRDEFDRSGDDFAAGGIGLIGTGRGGGGTGEGFMAVPMAPAPTTALLDSAEREPPKEEARAEKKSKAPAGASGRARGIVAGEAMAQTVSLRTVFATTAFFDAEVETDENGEARIDIPMPENLTTFRIMAVAVDQVAPDRFGSGESSVRVRKPVMIRPSLPRFANFGDTFEGSVMVDNQSSEAQQVLVGTRGLNVTLSGETQKLVEIPAGESREVRFDMAVEKVGKMRLQFAALSNLGRDATEVTLPIRYPATAKAFADYGMTDSSVQRTIEPPADALPAFGGLELTFSSTAMSGLEDAVKYLVDYEYECAEQTASRLLPIFTLGKILDEFPIAGITDQIERNSLAKDGIEKLLRHQLYDGGFGYWKADESWPYLTTWVTFALLEGKRAGFEVKADALERALGYIENFVRYGERTRWGVYYDWTTRAFGLWLLSGEKRGEGLFDVIWPHRDEMPLYARALLMSAAQRYGRTRERDIVLDELRDGAVETARTIHFAEARSEAASDGLRLLMHSNVQTDAIALMALLEIDATDTRLPKVIAAIMDDRDPKRGGIWMSTHANAWALVAASRYFETVEKDEPDFAARIWVDEKFAGQSDFKGRSMAKVEQRVPMDMLQGAATRQLTVQKDGVGKLYYRLGLRYAPASLKLPAVDNGFTVYREYEALPGPDGKVDPDAVKQTDDGAWIVKAGTNVKVTINLVVNDRANYVVVEDPLPAGFEGQNDKFVTSVGGGSSSTSASTRPYYDGWWWGWWYTFSHTDMRDDRMLLFADQLPAGVYTYSYTARATSIGKFLLPPVKAEEMYEPDRFGHGSSSSVTVLK